MIFLVVGILFAVVCGFVAAAKNKSVILWVFLGFLFGPIPLIILACSSAEPEEKPQGIQPALAALPENPSYDLAKWRALVEYDDDIKRAAETVRPFGPRYEARLASDYLALNDKNYLPQILEKVKAAAEAGVLSDKELAEERARIADFDRYVRRCYEVPTGKLVVLQNDRALAQVDGQIRAYKDPADFRDQVNDHESTWDEVVDPSQRIDFVHIFGDMVKKN